MNAKHKNNKLKLPGELEKLLNGEMKRISVVVTAKLYRDITDIAISNKISLTAQSRIIFTEWLESKSSNGRAKLRKRRSRN